MGDLTIEELTLGHKEIVIIREQMLGRTQEIGTIHEKIALYLERKREMWQKKSET